MQYAGFGPGRPAPTRRAMSAQRRRRLHRTLLGTAGVVLTVVLVMILAVRSRPPQSTPNEAAGASAATALAPAAPISAAPPGQPGSPVGDAGDGSHVGLGARQSYGQVVDKGSGSFTVQEVPGQDNRSGGREVRYTVEVEGGLEADAAAFAAFVGSTLRDARGWEEADHVHFSYVSPARARDGIRTDVRISLASPATVDKLCYPLKTNGEVSCSANGKVVINQKRWMLGAQSYGDDLHGYRTYLVNHEVGHALGHGHVSCPAAEARAPVMLQQTLGLQGCRAWPYPVMPD